MGFNCLKATEPLRGGSLLFTTKLTTTNKSTLEPPRGFAHDIVGFGIKRLTTRPFLYCFNHYCFTKSQMKYVVIMLEF